jgi:hypothetical protein
VEAWSASVHGSGPAFEIEGARPACTGCHSGSGFSAAIAAGASNTVDQKTALANPTRIDCRACHQIHTTYTGKDWALETVAAVKLAVFPDQTFDGGMGNLCANCHQMRSILPEAKDGKITVGVRFGGHHGPEAPLLMGIGGMGVDGKPSPHYKVENTCVGCHLGGAGEDANHSFMPQVATCLKCHTDAKDLDIKGEQTAIKAQLDAVKNALTAKGMLNKDGAYVAGDYKTEYVQALWNYSFILEDKSDGVHNYPYAKALLDVALANLSK